MGGRTQAGGSREVYPKGFSVCAPDGTDSVAQLISSQQKAGEDPRTSCLRDGGREIRPGNATHAGLEDRIVNAKEDHEPGWKTGRGADMRELPSAKESDLKTPNARLAWA